MSIFAKNAKNIFMKTSFTDKKENVYENSKSDWYRNKPGQNIIRMLPLREDGQPSFIQTVNHFFLKMKSDSGAIATVAPVCLDFLFREDGTDEEREYINNLVNWCFEHKKLYDKDFEQWESFGGCPLCRCYKALYKVDKTKSNEIAAKQRTYTLIKDRMTDNPNPNKLMFYSMSQTMWVEFMTQAKSLIIDDDIYVNDPDDGRDFKFTFVSNGRDSEYNGMTYSQKSSSFGDIEGDIPNLVKVWLSGVRDYNTLTDIVKTTPVAAKIALETGLKF